MGNATSNGYQAPRQLPSVRGKRRRAFQMQKHSNHDMGIFCVYKSMCAPQPAIGLSLEVDVRFMRCLNFQQTQ